MKTIDVKAQGQRKFVADIGMLEYPKWYSQMAEISVGESIYRIIATGFWKFRYEIIKDGKVVLTVTNTWNGYQITKYHDLERPLTIEPRGFLKNGYALLNHKKELLIEVLSDFSWKKFQQDYKINYEDDFGNDELDKVLMLLSVYFSITAQTAASGG